MKIRILTFSELLEEDKDAIGEKYWYLEHEGTILTVKKIDKNGDYHVIDNKIVWHEDWVKRL
jgi:hypothetical protein